MATHRIPATPPEDRDGFRYRGGTAVLDLTATLRARLSSAPQELLATPRDLDRWIVAAGLVASSPGADDADLRTARALREAIYVLAGERDAAALSVSACKVLNRTAKTPAAAPALRADGTAQLKGSVAQLLSTLARDAIHLFGSRAIAIRQCQSPTCAIYFIDTSRSGDRRWCSMSACGNKAKVAEFRRRRRAEEGGS
ncbi:MAG TPA: ABATE domain-containing protein [Tahibacter sp.]|uniref:CGNR zinc finger domain-containing protein n=1 Tax=Tahibacter sp. TaxID=2056211 RepID=UPI002CCFED03|nr:ABATE domain-containing protein [Tahibacter sp.]HSX59682.1 ABATE domain-containing protein [Tahibacter sp.]